MIPGASKSKCRERGSYPPGLSLGLKTAAWVEAGRKAAPPETPRLGLASPQGQEGPAARVLMGAGQRPPPVEQQRPLCPADGPTSAPGRAFLLLNSPLSSSPSSLRPPFSGSKCEALRGEGGGGSGLLQPLQPQPVSGCARTPGHVSPPAPSLGDPLQGLVGLLPACPCQRSGPLRHRAHSRKDSRAAAQDLYGGGMRGGAGARR